MQNNTWKVVQLQCRCTAKLWKNPSEKLSQYKQKITSPLFLCLWRFLLFLTLWFFCTYHTVEVHIPAAGFHTELIYFYQRNCISQSAKGTNKINLPHERDSASISIKRIEPEHLFLPNKINLPISMNNVRLSTSIKGIKSKSPFLPKE